MSWLQDHRMTGTTLEVGRHRVEFYATPGCLVLVVLAMIVALAL